MATQALLAVQNIEVIYDHVILVLKGVSLQVPEGGIVALLGANGAGKSTTLKAISGLLRTERGDVTKGSIDFRGRETIKLMPNHVARSGIVEQAEYTAGRRIDGAVSRPRLHKAAAVGRHFTDGARHT